jgi:hypothetical protein
LYPGREELFLCIITQAPSGIRNILNTTPLHPNNPNTHP